jgi:hypothetical protein
MRKKIIRDGFGSLDHVFDFRCPMAPEVKKNYGLRIGLPDETKNERRATWPCVQ